MKQYLITSTPSLNFWHGTNLNGFRMAMPDRICGGFCNLDFVKEGRILSPVSLC